MKKISAFLVLLTLMLGGPPPPAQAQLMINELNGFNSSASAAPPVITFLQCSTSNPTGTNPYTFASQNVGTASGDRYTLVGLATEDAATAFSVSSVAVNGDAATLVVDEGGTQLASAAFFILFNPAGTSEDVIVTMSEAISNSSVCLWSITGLSSTTATDTATGNKGGVTTTMTLDVDLSAGGVGAGICGEENTGRTFTWTGFTEEVDGNATGMARSASDYTATVAESGKSVTAKRDGGSGSAGCVTATFR